MINSMSLDPTFIYFKSYNNFKIKKITIKFMKLLNIFGHFICFRNNLPFLFFTTAAYRMPAIAIQL